MLRKFPASNAWPSIKTNKKLLQNRSWTFRIVLYFPWKLEIVSNILSMIVGMWGWMNGYLYPLFYFLWFCSNDFLENVYGDQGAQIIKKKKKWKIWILPKNFHLGQKKVEESDIYKTFPKKIQGQMDCF